MNDTLRPLRIEVAENMPGTQEECFELMALRLTEWEQGIQAIEWDDGNNIRTGSKRFVNLNGKRLVEQIVDWDPPNFYSYRFLLEESEVFFPLIGHIATLRVEKNKDDTCRVTWQQYYDKQIHPMSLIVTWFMRTRFMLPVIKRLVGKRSRL